MASMRANARKVICIGRNYADHIKELNNVRPKKPFFFLKPPSSILPPNSGPVFRPQGTTLHYEVELALIMGREVKDLDEKDEMGAIDAIDFYALAIDLTARNLQDEAKKKGLPWTIAKGFDTFCPISHPISKRLIPNPYNVELLLDINNKTMQSDSTGLMLFRIPRIMSEISQVMTLEKGDVVLTGTPKGVGEVKAGERMIARLSVEEELLETIDVKVEESQGMYEYKET